MNQKVVYSDNGCTVNGVYYSEADLRSLYIDQNYSQQQMCEYLSVSRGSIIEIVKHFQLFKAADVVKANRRQALLDKYGVDSAMKVEEFRQRSQQAIQAKYGGKSPLTNPTIRKKTQHTMLEKYGVLFPSQSREIVERRLDNYFKEHQVYTHFQQNIQHFDVWSDEKAFANFLRSCERKLTYTELAEYFHVDRTAVNAKVLTLQLAQYVNVAPGFSSYEDEIAKILVDQCGLASSDIERNVVGKLGDTKQEIDLFVPKFNFGIEFNGDYWHSDVFKNDHNGRSLYHQAKSLMAEEAGIFLFHIFEYEWRNTATRQQIISRLKTILHQNSVNISARETVVVELTKQQKKDFLCHNHIQGNDHSTCAIGLIKGGEIVACMTFVHPKNNKYTWELSRFCTKNGCNVRGGASKLFSHFVERLQVGNTVSSYSDITKTKGALYEILGFTCVSVNEPNYVWLNFHTEDIRTRYQEQAADEVNRMHNAGYHRVCDSGTKTWVYIKK